MHSSRINPFIISIQRHSVRKNAIFCLICINVDAGKGQINNVLAYVAVFLKSYSASAVGTP